MGDTAGGIETQIAAAEAHFRAGHQAIAAALTLARCADPGDADTRAKILDAAELVGRGGQRHEGELIQLLAEAERFKGGRGGLVPWIATHLDVTQGAARGIAQSAKEIGHLPELSETLSSGNIGACTIRVMTRTARAVKNTQQDLSAALAETLKLSTTGSVGDANRHVRILEETLDPGRAERRLEQQRRRSFLRFTACENEMTRMEVLLDEERATELRTAIDKIVSGDLHTRQYDGAAPEPDIETTEQFQAEALAKLAKMYLNATPDKRDAPYSATVLYTASVNPAEHAGLAVTNRGRVIARSVMPPIDSPTAHLLEYDENSQPIYLDRQLLDLDPHARLASPAQRIALAWRDKTCTHPGCTRPPAWSLHAHHVTPHGRGGLTIMRNLVFLCAEHHTLVHHPGL